MGLNVIYFFSLIFVLNFNYMPAVDDISPSALHRFWSHITPHHCCEDFTNRFNFCFVHSCLRCRYLNRFSLWVLDSLCRRPIINLLIREKLRWLMKNSSKWNGLCDHRHMNHHLMSIYMLRKPKLFTL